VTVDFDAARAVGHELNHVAASRHTRGKAGERRFRLWLRHGVEGGICFAALTSVSFVLETSVLFAYKKFTNPPPIMMP